MAIQRGKKNQETVLVNSEDITWIKDNLMKMQSSLTQLEHTIIGNEQYGQKGLVPQVAEHQKYIDKHKNFQAKLVGAGLVVSGLWAIVINKIFN